MLHSCRCYDNTSISRLDALGRLALISSATQNSSDPGAMQPGHLLSSKCRLYCRALQLFADSISEVSMAWRTPLNVTRPVVGRPYQKNGLEHEDMWCPYPRADPQISYNARRIDDAGFSLYVIGVDICSVILSGNPQDSPLPGHIILEPAERLARAHSIEHDLLAWQDDLPPILPDQLMSGPAMNLQ